MVAKTSTVPSVANGKKSTNLGCMAELNGGRLILSVPFDAEGALSGSGKSKVHASTRGNTPIAINGEVYMCGINVFKKV